MIHTRLAAYKSTIVPRRLGLWETARSQSSGSRRRTHEYNSRVVIPRRSTGSVGQRGARLACFASGRSVRATASEVHASAKRAGARGAVYL